VSVAALAIIVGHFFFFSSEYRNGNALSRACILNPSARALFCLCRISVSRKRVCRIECPAINGLGVIKYEFFHSSRVIMISLLLLLSLVSMVRAIVYTDGYINGDIAVFNAARNVPGMGNVQNSPLHQLDVDIDIGALLSEDYNMQIPFLLANGTYEFVAVNQLPANFDVLCNGVLSPVQQLAGDRYSIDVSDALHEMPKSINCRKARGGPLPVVALSEDEEELRPKIVVTNRPILKTLPAAWRKTVAIPGDGKPLEFDMNVAYLQVGECDSPLETLVLWHPQPSWSASLVPMLAELEIQQAGSGRCFLAPDQFGSGFTLPVAPNDKNAIVREKIYPNAQALVKEFMAFAKSLNASAPLDILGAEWNSRHAIEYPSMNPNVIRNVIVHTPFYNPSSAFEQTACKRTDGSTTIEAPGLNAIVPGFGTFFCDPTVPANLPQGLRITDPDLCYNTIHRCDGISSEYGPLGDFADSIQVAAGVYIPSQSTYYGFGEFLLADPAVGDDAAYIIRCNFKYGPGGFGHAAGQRTLFSIREWDASEIAYLDEPIQFDGLAMDLEKINATCYTASPNSGVDSLIPQPSNAQMFAATTVSNPFETFPGVFGLTPGQAEDPYVRSQHTQGVAFIKNGTLANSVTGGLFNLVPDVSLGYLFGYSGIHNVPLMQWNFGVENVRTFESYGFQTMTVGPAGGHLGVSMDQPDVAAYRIGQIMDS